MAETMTIDSFLHMLLAREWDYRANEAIQRLSLIHIYIVPASATAYGHECCAYCYPVTERMFKINCKTHTDGLIHELYVTIYNSCLLYTS